MKNIVCLILIGFIILGCGESKLNKTKLIPYDFRLFRDTPAEELASAVKKEDLEEIERQIKEKGIDVNYTDSINGNNLLFLAVGWHKYESTKKLLELGANPNQVGERWGTAPMIEAAGTIWGYDAQPDIQFLKLLLEYGGDPNLKAIRRKDVEDGKYPIRTPLEEAVQSSYENTKLLIKKGADVNFYSENNSYSILYEASAWVNGLEKPVAKNTKLLLCEGIDFKKSLHTRRIDSSDIFLLENVEEWQYPIATEGYRIKREIINFLEGRISKEELCRGCCK